MKRKLLLVIAVVLGLMALPGALPAHAITTAIGNFYGGCGNFSVDLAVYGTQDDGGGVDKIRYRVTDGNGKTLYQEDQVVRVGVAVGSLVMNLPYQHPAVDKNPVRFAVVNLDKNGNDAGEVGFVTYNAPCQSSVGGTSRSGVFTPSGAYQGKALSASYLYQSPNAGRLDLLTKVDQIYPVLYRSADGTWVAISVGGGEYVWVPTSTISVDLGQLTFPPSQIQGSGIKVGQNAPSGPTVAAGFNGTAIARGTLNIRSAPTGQSASLGSVPANASFTVTGRDAYRAWLKITYNGTVGWVSAYYVNIKSADLRALPVVQ